MEHNKIAVFCDFDGTITKLDIGDEIFRVFGQIEPFHSQLYEGKLSIDEYWHSVCNSLKIGITREEIENFAIGQEVDANFVHFVDFCRKENIYFKVISDGFDVYIQAILNSLNLNDLDVHCNKMLFDSGRPVPFFTLASESCGCRMTASCKRNAMLTACDDETVIIFIGDGASDFCCAQHADIVFAKKKLAAYCNEMRIPHYPFSNFFDIYRILGNLITKKKLKTRYQAFLKRKKAFEDE